jgi:hypothetical protein
VPKVTLRNLGDFNRLCQPSSANPLIELDSQLYRLVTRLDELLG